MVNWLGWVGTAVDAATSVMNNSAQRAANSKNIKLNREQRDWEQMMSNSAVQRRADDIEKAGGNRALAFTNGSEATTPTVTPAHVDPPQWSSPKINSGLLLKAQLDQIEASTAVTKQQARQEKITADAMEKFGLYNAESDSMIKSWNVEANKIRLKILENQNTSSAAEAKRLSESVDAAIAKARQEAEIGKLDMESAQRIAKEFGLNQSAAASFIRLILDAMKTINRKD